MPKSKKAKKSNKVESINIKRAKQGFVVESYGEGYDNQETNIATDISGVNKLVKSLIG